MPIKSGTLTNQNSLQNDLEKTAVIYARYSSSSQREESIEDQINACKKYAEDKGFAIVGVYSDYAKSGTTDDRPEFQRMILESGRHCFRYIFVWKLDRFARNKNDSVLYKKLLSENNVWVKSVCQDYDDSPEGSLMVTIFEGMDDYYSKNLRQNIYRGQDSNAEKLMFNGGSLPLGYITDQNQHYIVERSEAEVVKEIFKRFAAGELAKEIISSLNRRGIKTKLGKEFTYNSLFYMLHNERYLGTYRYRNVCQENAFEAIITTELFERVQYRLERQKHARAHMKCKAPIEFLLSGKVVCGDCGANMVGESGTSRNGAAHYYYKCANAKRKKGCKKRAVRKDALENAIIDYTVHFVLSDKMIEKISKELYEKLQKDDGVLDLLEKQTKELEKRIRNMVSAIEKGVISETLVSGLNQAEEQKKELGQKIAEAKMKKPQITQDMIVFWMKQFRGGDTQDINYVRSLIEMFIEKIYIYDDKILIEYNGCEKRYALPFDNMCSDCGAHAPPKNREAFWLLCFFMKIAGAKGRGNEAT